MVTTDLLYQTVQKQTVHISSKPSRSVLPETRYRKSPEKFEKSQGANNPKTGFRILRARPTCLQPRDVDAATIFSTCLSKKQQRSS